MAQSKRTFIVRITTPLSFGALAAKLSEAGDVEHIQLKDGSVNALTAHTLPGHGNMLPALHGNGRRRNVLSDQSKHNIAEAARKYMKDKRAYNVAMLSDILRSHANAPLIKLAQLMNATVARPNRSAAVPWTEGSISSILDEAIEHVTSPSAPPLKG